MLTNLLFWGILIPGLVALAIALLAYSALIVASWNGIGRDRDA